MTNPNTKTSALVVIAPRILNDKQRALIAASMRSDLPPDVGVIVLDKDFTVLPVASAGLAVDLVGVEVPQDETFGLILIELSKLNAELRRRQAADAARLIGPSKY